MFRRHNIITAIEIGTSKICVLVGKISSDKELEVIGFGECPSNNSVMKGEIIDMDVAAEQLEKAILQADSNSNHMVSRTNITAISITGPNISSSQGNGAIFIANKDKRIGDTEIAEVIKKAQENSIPPDRKIINSADSYFVIDSHRRIRNPRDIPANKLEVFIHAVHGSENLIEAFYSLLDNAGFDNEFVPVFSGIASGYGALTDEEQDAGVLLLDMGAGTCEYIVVFNMGVITSGVLPIGFEHLANDLSLGLDLHISDCRKLFQEETIIRHIQQHKAFIEVKSGRGDIRKIPLTSVEKIIDLRLRETLQIIHDKLAKENALTNLNSGAVLTGGGALFPNTALLFGEIFSLPVRIGQPFSANKNTRSAGLENPRYAAVWGTLKFVAESCKISGFRLSMDIARQMINGADGMASRFLKTIRKIPKAIRF